MANNDPVFRTLEGAKDLNTGLIVRAFDPSRQEYRLADVSELDDHSVVAWIKWTGAGVHLVGLLLGRGIIWTPEDNAQVMAKVRRLDRALEAEYNPKKRK